VVAALSAASLLMCMLGVSYFQEAFALSPVLAVVALWLGLIARARQESNRVLWVLGIVMSTLSLAAFVGVLGWIGSRA